jgi:RHS repeat-associated protein
LLLSNVGFRQEFVLRDHFGNARVHFSDLNGDGALQPFACNPAVPCVPLGNGGGYTEMLQVQHYYPFGMEFDGPWEMPLDPDEINHYTYNGKELNRDFGLGWLDYGARWYDAAVGRFPSVDPLADKRSWVSPYNYVQNNPILRIDPTGALDKEYVIDKNTGEKKEISNAGGNEVDIIHTGTIHEDGAVTTDPGSTKIVDRATTESSSDSWYPKSKNSLGVLITPDDISDSRFSNSNHSKSGKSI